MELLLCQTSLASDVRKGGDKYFMRIIFTQYVFIFVLSMIPFLEVFITVNGHYRF